MKKRLMIFTTMGLLAVAEFAFGTNRDRTLSCPWEGTPSALNWDALWPIRLNVPLKRMKLRWPCRPVVQSESKRVWATNPFSCEHLIFDTVRFK